MIRPFIENNLFTKKSAGGNKSATVISESSFQGKIFLSCFFLLWYFLITWLVTNFIYYQKQPSEEGTIRTLICQIKTRRQKLMNLQKGIQLVGG